MDRPCGPLKGGRPLDATHIKWMGAVDRHGGRATTSSELTKMTKIEVAVTGAERAVAGQATVEMLIAQTRYCPGSVRC